MTQLETSAPADKPTGNVEVQAEKTRRRRSRSGLKKWRRRLQRIFSLRNVLAFVFGFSAVAVVGGLVLTTDARNRVGSSLDSLSRVTDTLSKEPGTQLTATDFTRLQASVNDLEQNLAAAQRQTFFLRPFASLNPDLKATLQSLDAASELAQAGSDMLTGLQPTMFFLAPPENNQPVATQISSGERIVELLQIGRGLFISAQNHLAAADVVIKNLDLAQVSPQLLLNLEGLGAYQSQLTQINNILLQAPDLLTTALGLSQERTLLILSENSDELRPSGGYISTYGWLRVRNARVVDFDYSPTTSTSPNPPSASLASQVNVPPWWIQYQQPIYAAWDGSWYADFPSTARMSMWYYDNGNNPHSPVDGVISIDLTGFEYLLQAIGSVVMPDTNEVITSDNFRAIVYKIRASGEGDLPHKRFLAEVYRQIFAAWQGIDQDKSTAVLGALLQALQEKHIMLYFNDEGLNNAINVLGWSGRQAPAADSDYLMVADANLGNKSNHSIIRQLTYDVQIMGDGSLQSRATVSYDYPARLASTDPGVNPEHNGPLDYNNLLQVFVPKGSLLTGSDNFPDRPPQLVTGDGYDAFVSTVQVPYDNGERFQYTYTSQARLDTFGPYQRYRLLLQKQPGTPGDTVSVQISLPPNAEVVNTTPAASASYTLEQPILEFRSTLTTDQTIEVIFRTQNASGS